MAVELAEAAAATATAITLWEHHKAVGARLTSSARGLTMPDGRTTRPTTGSVPCSTVVRKPAAAPGNLESDGSQPDGNRTEPPRAPR